MNDPFTITRRPLTLRLLLELALKQGILTGSHTADPLALCGDQGSIRHLLDATLAGSEITTEQMDNPVGENPSGSEPEAAENKEMWLRIREQLAADLTKDIHLNTEARTTILEYVDWIEGQNSGYHGVMTVLAEQELGMDALIADRETLGRIVRDEWIAWAKEQPDEVQAVHPHWLMRWNRISESEREVDRRIGERIGRHLKGEWRNNGTV